MSLNSDDDETDAEYVPDKEFFEDESESGTKPRSTTLGSRRSKTWDYFDLDDSTGVGCCRFCRKEVPYRSVADLKTHIDSEHARIEELETGDGDGNLNTTTGRKKLSCMIWKYFDVHDAEAKVAKCKSCGKHLLYHTLNNLNKHLKRSHAKLDPGLASIGPGDSATVKKEPKRKKYNLKAGPRNERVNRSKVWNYYTIVDPDAKVAKCTLCHRKFAYTYLTNLKKHLNRKHRGELTAASSDEEAEMDDEQTTPVWAYFKSLDKTLKIASCLVCKKRIEYRTDEELMRHLNRKHPYIDLDSIRKKPKKLMITGNGDIYEIDDGVAKLEPPTTPDGGGDASDDWPRHRDEVDALHASETYLDESIFDESPYIPAAKKRKFLQNTHTTHEDSLDMFGKYMVSLLRNLSKKKADRLQVEFVKQIMEANNDESNRYEEQVLNSSSPLSADDARVTSNTEQRTKELASDEVTHHVKEMEEIIVTSVINDEMLITRDSN